MSDAIQKTMSTLATSSGVIDLRPLGATGTNYAKATYLEIKALKSGASDCEVYIRLVKVADGQPAPTATSLGTLLAPESPQDFILLNSLNSPSVVVGEKFGSGYNRDAFQGKYYTHVLYNTVADGNVSITGQ